MNTSKFASKKPKELDLRYANPEAQAYVREQAIRLHQEGWTNVDIAKHFNVHKNTVGKWLNLNFPAFHPLKSLQSLTLR